MSKKPLTDDSGEVRELTREDIKEFRSAGEVLPESLFAILPNRKVGQRGTQKAAIKKSVTVRYSLEVLNYFRSTGRGWQTRMDEALKEWIEQRNAHSSNISV
ncbi:MAG: BrnA antitoxin family protein [Desulfobacterales bacterium]|nr:BrnA antitoxin family protein [Desulfobacterales bacterium]